MKFYIAASFDLKEEVKQLYALLESHGHEITKDWTDHIGTAPEEREEKRQLVERYAVEDIDGVRAADVFVILSAGPVGTGRYIELGAAIQSHLEKGIPQIYVVGNDTAHSLFYYHPSVKQRDTIEVVLAELAAE